MDSAELGELQPQPLSLRFGMLALGDPRDPLRGSSGETPFSTLPEDMIARGRGCVEEGNGVVSGGHSGPIGLTAMLLALFAPDLALLLYPGPSQPTCCPRDWGMSNEAEKCPHRHSPVLVTRLSWQLLEEKVEAGVRQESLPCCWQAGGSPWGRGLFFFSQHGHVRTCLGTLGTGPLGVFFTTSSLEMDVCRQACPAHIPLQVIAGRVMLMG